MTKRSEYQEPWFHRNLIDGAIQSGYSIPEIAKRARISKSHAYRIFFELQWPSIPVMLRLERAMGMKKGELLSEKSSIYGTFDSLQSK